LIFVSHDRYFVDRIAKKLFIFKGNGTIEESFEKYSEYLENEKDIKFFKDMEKIEQNKNQPQQPKQQPQKQIKKQKKLSYKDQREYDTLMETISDLEDQISKLNQCLSDPKCYETEGLVTLSDKLTTLEQEYETKVNRYLELEELIETLKNN
jgi:ATP-binding cassette subfamily F protein uup